MKYICSLLKRFETILQIHSFVNINTNLPSLLYGKSHLPLSIIEITEVNLFFNNQLSEDKCSFFIAFANGEAPVETACAFCSWDYFVKLSRMFFATSGSEGSEPTSRTRPVF